MYLPDGKKVSAVWLYYLDAAICLLIIVQNKRVLSNKWTQILSA